MNPLRSLQRFLLCVSMLAMFSLAAQITPQ
jgi:hypothetical protein